MNWPAYLRLGRVSNLPTVWTNTLAGIVLAGGTLEGARLEALLGAFSLFYVGGMFLNDAFDREIDARERPDRPIPAGLVRASTVFGIGSAMLAAGVGILAAQARWGSRGGWGAVAAGVALAALIVLYDARHKGNPWAPVLMGLCRVLVYVTAALAATHRLTLPLIGGAIVLLAYLIGLTSVAAHETLPHQRPRLRPLVLVGVPLLYGIPILLSGPVGAVLYAGFLGWVGYATSFLVRHAHVDVPRAVVSFLAGICLLDALLIAGTGQSGVAAWGVVGFALTVLLQRYVRGT